MKKLLVIGAVFCATHLFAQIDNEDSKRIGLEYLNDLRTKVGMSSLSLNDELSTAAYNHSNYCVINHISGHYENSSDEGFTGVTPSDRALYAGYESKSVSENFSLGQNDINKSIDNLFSAIYHRFGFLNPTITEIGIGVFSNDITAFTYDMGNSNLNTLCLEDNYDSGSYYTNVCKNEELKIPVNLFDDAIKNSGLLNPKIIIWPYSDAVNIDPVFYEETPDPLPNQSVSGYPISIQFNKYYYRNIPTLLSFKIFDKDGNEITDTKLLNKETDPNSEFDEYEYALYPLKRLEWGEKYKVEIQYKDNDIDEVKTIEWNFTTKGLKYPFYKVENNDLTLKVKSGQIYDIYFVPQNENDTITGFNYSYNVSDVNFSYIDSNTLQVKVTGDIGKKVDVTLSNGIKVHLVISDEDNAILPLNQNIDNESIDELNNVITNLDNGWHILGFSNKIDFNNINSNFKIIWVYKNGEWCGYSKDSSIEYNLKDENKLCEEIEENQGFWILK